MENQKNDNTNNKLEDKNKIKGIIEININDINKNIILFNTEINRNIDVYINQEKINIIKENNKWQYKFNKIGKYMFEIVFNDNITNCKSLFSKCINIISLDLSNFNNANVTDMEDMFSECNKLKEVKGINKLITNKVTNMSAMFQKCNELEYLDLSINKFITNKVAAMNAMFQECTELEYLDLSNFNTDNVTNMEGMFNKCNKLKEIKGIYKLITNKVTTMKAMLQECNELEYLDLSNFNTANVTNMEFMFYNCNKLKILNLLNFTINCETKNMLKFNKKECKFTAQDKKLVQLYNSS